LHAEYGGIYGGANADNSGLKYALQSIGPSRSCHIRLTQEEAEKYGSGSFESAASNNLKD
jgi:hypothetical protein